MTPTVCFLWHMHQPSYVDRGTLTARLPWVRLHSTKAYYDMVTLAERFPQIRQTFNLVPSLIDQLLDLVDGRVQDRYAQLTLTPAGDLKPDERVCLLQQFFMANWETMIRPVPRYWDLLLKRGTTVAPHQWPSVARRFSTQDLLDLQVWFNLAWCGFAARARFPQIDALRTKGERFGEEDKRTVIETQFAIMREIVPRYRALEERGIAELTTSPFYHPILPLLVDSDCAARALPAARLPLRFAAPDDAREQLARGAAFHERVFGRRPAGLWPPEGSVSPEIVPVAASQGFRWMASDQGVLGRSVAGDEGEASPYMPYRVTVDGVSLTMIFRDRVLSDLIGFTYARNRPEAAAEDFMDRVAAIGAREPGRPMAAVILDGENPWESYPDGGEAFLTAVYRRLDASAGARAATISAAIADAPTVRPLLRLHSGSWINQSFAIWIGHPEDNQAWALLRHTRQFLAAQGAEGRHAPQGMARAWDALYAAEGSDWMWWYGDDFSTPLAGEFDSLFRSHLAAVYQILDEPVPATLRHAIKVDHGEEPAREPMRLMSPTIDGRATSFYEWWSASHYRVRSDAGQMYCPIGYLNQLAYGFDLERFYLRLDPTPALLGSPPGRYAGRCHILQPHPYMLTFDLAKGERPGVLMRGEGPKGEAVSASARVAVDRVVELAIAFADLGVTVGDRVEFVVELLEGPVELGRYPHGPPCAFVVPGPDFEATMWSA